ncbi:MAG: hypothetical protein LBV12_05705 [Puniceicoccales bacterium]|jgi:ferric-dicitrate binding protein FerR (iron transport regulator)|nr:hypothetical protein [Puniceicoccales bacterium]
MSPKKNPDNTMPPEFYSLAERKFAGTISREEHDRLEKYLLQFPAAMEYYLSLCTVEAAMPGALRIHREEQSQTGAGNVFSFRRRLAGISSIVALFVIAVAGYAFWKQADVLPLPVSVAESGPLCRVSLVLGASFENKRIEPNSPLEQETFSIDAGVAELVFRQGTHVLLEAPASLTVTGSNACRLAYGKAVVTVPDSAKGFVMESPKDRVIDHGTRFAMDVSLDGERTLLGVLSGVVDLEHKDETVRLFTDYAVERNGDNIKSVPFERGDFLTEMPSQEYAWNLDGMAFDEVHKLRFDVTRLIKTPGEIHVIFKLLVGANGLWVKRISLERNGEEVMVSNIHRRSGSIIKFTHDNFFPLELPGNIPLTGKWELVADAVCTRHVNSQPPGSTISSQGIFIFEKGVLHNAVAEDFIGRWQFSHDSKTYVDEFLPDGTVKMSINGVLRDFEDKLPVWSFKDGVVTIDFRRPGWVPLKVILRNKDTMIFLNQTYRNAQRME